MGMANKGYDIHGVLIVMLRGLTSSNVVHRLKRWSNKKGWAHRCSRSMATGVLPIVFGEAAKYSQYGLDSKKGYLRVSSALQLTLDAEV